MKLTILGSGTSHGVPMIGCSCAVCRSEDPFDLRSRPSAMLELDDKRVLIDSGPELRMQLIRERIDMIHAVVYTHAHADHIYGLDDLRVFSMRGRGPLNAYATPDTAAVIRTVFPYVFNGGPSRGGGVPQITLNEINGPFEGAGIPFQPIPIWHGPTPVMAYRVGDLAYVTDVSRIEPESLNRLRGLDVLVLDALRFRPHPTHFSIPEALAIVDDLKPKRTFFTHICHDLPHAETNRHLPPGVELAYDGLVIELANPIR